MQRKGTLAAALCLALLSAAPSGCGGAADLPPVAAAAAAPGYGIILHRRLLPGARGLVSTTIRSHRSMVMQEGSEVVKRDEESLSIDFKAAVTVLTVDPGGTPVEIQYSIQSLLVERAPGERKALMAGRVVVADRGPKKVTFRATPALSEDEEKALSQVVSPRSPGSTDDDVFGTSERQALGATWPINAARMAKELEGTGIRVQPDAVSGQVRLVGLVKADGRDCLEIAGEFTVRDAWPSDIPGARADKGEIRSTYHAILPIDISAPELESALTVDVDLGMLISVSPDHEARATMISRKSTRRRFTPLR